LPAFGDVSRSFAYGLGRFCGKLLQLGEQVFDARAEAIQLDERCVDVHGHTLF